MPTYDYACKACGKTMEIFHSIADAPKRKCPLCKKSALERKIGAGAGILFKGTGFYQTDYRSDAYQKAAKADSGASPASDSSTSESKGGETPASDAKSSDAKPGAESKPAPQKSSAKTEGTPSTKKSKKSS
ncbi:MAG: FmdB family zinc ribbon protein [Planctomycetota bacterium]